MFRFTIRDLLWLTVVVAMGVGWWAHRSRLMEQIDRIVSRILLPEPKAQAEKLRKD